MKGNFAIAALSSPLLHQLPFPVWLLALKSAIIFLLLWIAEVSSYPKGSMEIFGHSILNHFSGFNVRTPAFRRWNWFFPVFCCSFVLLLISFSSEFSVLAFCSFCSLIDKMCYRSGRWDLKKKSPSVRVFWGAVHVCVGEKNEDALSVLQKQSVSRFKFLVVCIVWSTMARFKYI